MTAVRAYLLAVTAASLLTGAVSSLLPKGRMLGIIQLLGSMILVLTVVSPIVEADLSLIPTDLEQIHADATDIGESSLQDREQLLSQLIKERCEAYILDRADRSGVKLEVQIIMGLDDYPHPIGVKIYGDVGMAVKHSLSTMIEQDLGIPTHQQEWFERE